MRCPHCKKTISTVSEMHCKMNELEGSRFFPNEIQDIGAELIRKGSHAERLLLSLLELAYRRGQTSDPLEQLEYVDENGNVLENVIESLLEK